MKTYTLASKQTWLSHTTNTFPAYVQDLNIKELENLESHIDLQDYFGSLATVMSLIQQQPKDRSQSQHVMINEMFAQIIDELKHLQRHYQIIEKKTKIQWKTKKRSGRSS